MDDYHDKSGWGGGAAIILLFVFLLILFAVFSGRGFGHDGHAGGHGGYPAYPPAYPAYAGYGSCGVAGYPPGWQIEKDFCCVKDTVKDGDYCLSKQIAETAACAETRYYQGRLEDKEEENNTLKMALMKKDIEGFVGTGFNGINGRITDIECKMLKKPELEAIAGIHNVSCTNVPMPPPYPPIMYPPYPMPYGGGFWDGCRDGRGFRDGFRDGECRERHCNPVQI